MYEKLTAAVILVVEDVHEISESIEKLLRVDGYRVTQARNESKAIESARLTRPDLILLSWIGLSSEVIATVSRIREQAEISEHIPMVFWVEDLNEGEEIEVDRNVHLTRPDSFNQLRGLLARLLHPEIVGATHADKPVLPEMN